MPGVELQAAAIATMFRDAPVRDTSQLVDVLTIVVIAALGAAVALLALPLSIVAFAAVALAFLATAQYLFAGRTSRSPWRRRCSRWRSRSWASWPSRRSAQPVGTPGLAPPGGGFLRSRRPSPRAH